MKYVLHYANKFENLENESLYSDPKQRSQFNSSHNYRQMLILAKDIFPGKAYRVFQAKV